MVIATTSQMYINEIGEIRIGYAKWKHKKGVVGD